MNDDSHRISYQDLLRDPDLIDRVQRDARRYRAREIRRMLSEIWGTSAGPRRSAPPRLRTASCG
jgi:hypothetical protein